MQHRHVRHLDTLSMETGPQQMPYYVVVVMECAYIVTKVPIFAYIVTAWVWLSVDFSISTTTFGSCIYLTIKQHLLLCVHLSQPNSYRGVQRVC